jgi:hypothetical protein
MRFHSDMPARASTGRTKYKLRLVTAAVIFPTRRCANLALACIGHMRSTNVSYHATVICGDAEGISSAHAGGGYISRYRASARRQLHTAETFRSSSPSSYGKPEPQPQIIHIYPSVVPCRASSAASQQNQNSLNIYIRSRCLRHERETTCMVRSRGTMSVPFPWPTPP